MSKYIRHQPIINRSSDENISEDHWLKQFEKNLQKGAVQPRSQQSIFDQITSIMNRNTSSKYTSVDAAVEDMKARSGFTSHLSKVKKAEENQETNIKVANDKKSDKKTPIVISKCPGILETLERYISESKGHLPVPAIIDKIKTIHQGDISESKDWEDDRLIYLVSDLNLKAKKNNPDTFNNYHNLGARDSMSDADIDPSNTDAFFALNPAKI